MKTKIKRHSRSVLAVVLTLCMLVSCMTVGIIATDAAKTAEERVGAVDNSEAVDDDSVFYYDFRNISGGVNFYRDGTLAYDANGGGKIKVGNLPPSGDTVIAKWAAGGWDTPTVKSNDGGISTNNMLVVTSDTTYTFGTYVPIYYVRGDKAGLSWNSGTEMDVTGTIRYLYVNDDTKFKIVSPDGWAADKCTEYNTINNEHSGENIDLSVDGDGNVSMPSAGFICFDTSSNEIYARSTSPVVTSYTGVKAAVSTSPSRDGVATVDPSTGTTVSSTTGTTVSYTLNDSNYEFVNWTARTEREWRFIFVFIFIIQNYNCRKLKYPYG